MQVMVRVRQFDRGLSRRFRATYRAEFQQHTVERRTVRGLAKAVAQELPKEELLLSVGVREQVCAADPNEYDPSASILETFERKLNIQRSCARYGAVLGRARWYAGAFTTHVRQSLSHSVKRSS
ncbi:MAG: hypothetical protein OXR66_07170 [Candidatus Woesearchaeota archaeon]|nr:hypothetical protein [Candidatus Woesearchaeota archaeon]